MTDHDQIDKKSLSERDICTKFITPAIRDVAGWNDLQFLEEFTLGKIHVRGKRVARGVRDRADYILFYKKQLPLAIIEAKDNNHEIGAGMQQALRYSEMLDIPFAYSSNGDGFIEHDRTRAEGPLERELGLNQFPSPQELWERYKAWKQITPEEEKIVTQPYFIGDKPPRTMLRQAQHSVPTATILSLRLRCIANRLTPGVPTLKRQGRPCGLPRLCYSITVK